MGQDNPPHGCCPDTPYKWEEFFWPPELCYDFCAFGQIFNWDDQLLPCKDESGWCTYEALFATCAIVSGFALCLAFYRMASNTCSTQFSEETYNGDIPRKIQYDYLNLYFDTVLFDLYIYVNPLPKVLSLRSRPESINIKIKFDPAEFVY